MLGFFYYLTANIMSFLSFCHFEAHLRRKKANNSYEHDIVDSSGFHSIYFSLFRSV